MTPALIKVLLVEDDPGDAFWIKEVLEEPGKSLYRFELQHCSRLSDARQYLTAENPDAILLDLGLPDSQGLQTLQGMLKAAPGVPVVVLTGLADEEFGVAAVQQGAQDYLLKGQLNRDLLVRSLRYALERRRAEEALRQALVKAEQGDRLLTALMEHVPEGITIADASGQLRLVSRRGQELLGGAHSGRSVEEVAAEWTVYGADGITPMASEDLPLARALHQGEVVQDAELVQVNARGERLSLLCNAAPIRDAAGEVVGGIVAWRDITSRKRAEEALKESEARFRTMANAIPQLVWMAKSDGYIFWYNQRWYEYTGTTPEDMQGWGWQSVHDPEMLPQVLERWRASLASGEPFEMVFPLRAANGQFRRFLTRVLPLKDANGQVIQWFGTNTDIDARLQVEEALRQSEARLAEAQRLAHLGNWERDISQKELTWSDEVYRIFGLVPQESKVTYEDFLSFIYPDDLTTVKNQVEEGMKFGKYGPYEYRIVWRDGSIRFVYAHGETYFNQEGQPLRMRGTVQDITELKRAEEALKRAHDELEQRVRERTEELRLTVQQLQKEVRERLQAEDALSESREKLRYLTSQLMTAQEAERKRISLDLHDGMGQSLTYMKLTIRYVMNNLPPHMADLRQECQHLLDYVGATVNDVRRLCRQLVPCMLEDVGLAAALENLVNELERFQDIEVDLHIDASFNQWFDLEAQTAIYRIFQEALNNIAKHAQATQVAIAITNNGNLISISLEDNGKGFDQEQIRSRSATERGIGLTAMEERVRMLGGNLEIQSQREVGTRIFIRIPVPSGSD